MKIFIPQPRLDGDGGAVEPFETAAICVTLDRVESKSDKVVGAGPDVVDSEDERVRSDEFMKSSSLSF